MKKSRYFYTLTTVDGKKHISFLIDMKTGCNFLGLKTHFLKCEQLRFIFQHSPLCVPRTFKINVAVLESHSSKTSGTADMYSSEFLSPLGIFWISLKGDIPSVDKNIQVFWSSFTLPIRGAKSFFCLLSINRERASERKTETETERTILIREGNKVCLIQKTCQRTCSSCFLSIHTLILRNENVFRNNLYPWNCWKKKKLFNFVK